MMAPRPPRAPYSGTIAIGRDARRERLTDGYGRANATTWQDYLNLTVAIRNRT